MNCIVYISLKDDKGDWIKKSQYFDDLMYGSSLPGERVLPPPLLSSSSAQWGVINISLYLFFFLFIVRQNARNAIKIRGTLRHFIKPAGPERGRFWPKVSRGLALKTKVFVNFDSTFFSIANFYHLYWFDHRLKGEALRQILT